MANASRTPRKPKPAWALAIELRRTALQLSQEIIAERAEMSQSYYSDVERGDKSLLTLTVGKLIGLARALNWTLTELQRATGVDLGIMDATLIAEGSADVYPLRAALTPDQPGTPVDHEAVAPGLKRPLLLRADTDEMQGLSNASIRPGSTLHLDLDRTTPEEGRVYVLTDDGGVHLRLYTATRLGPVFRAENRTHEDIPAQDAHIVGMVVEVATDYHPELN
ncbi:helix-turn-helix domain-containing protein [Deinococcus yunweiensis]|uniref:helix-turn-helix domain-containing protein n=1 Tax=Deinococcus yunweiensis TaxID=367282 RepID=UPI00398EC414